jgi:hypothetical protein
VTLPGRGAAILVPIQVGGWEGGVESGMSRTGDGLLLLVTPTGSAGRWCCPPAGRWGDLILLHTVTPILVLTAIGLAVTAAVALAGLVPVPALPLAAAACLPVAAALVWSAAIAGSAAASGSTSS